MAVLRSSWWHDTRILYARYTIAVGAAVPEAVIYSYLAVHGRNTVWLSVLLFVCGMISSFVVWIKLERHYLSSLQQIITIHVRGDKSTKVIPPAKEFVAGSLPVIFFPAVTMAQVNVVVGVPQRIGQTWQRILRAA